MNLGFSIFRESQGNIRLEVGVGPVGECYKLHEPKILLK